MEEIINKVVKKNHLVKYIFLLFMLVCSNHVMAVGLGKLTVNSHLNELLSAEIVLTGVNDIEINNIIASIASPKDFMRAGIPRPFFLSDLRFETKRKNNTTIIHIYTKKIIKNPFLDFLIELVWPDGKLIKGYTILLDPKPDPNSKPKPKPKSSDVSVPTFGDINRTSKNSINYELGNKDIAEEQLRLAKNSLNVVVANGQDPDVIKDDKQASFSDINTARKNNIDYELSTKSIGGKKKYPASKAKHKRFGNQNKDSVLITSLEESIENEALQRSEYKNSNNSYKLLQDYDDNPTDLMFATTEPKYNQPQDLRDPDFSYDQDINNSGGQGKEVLNKVVSSLQIFAENSKRPKIDYEKLLDLKPTSLPNTNSSEKMVENMAMQQINSELTAMRNQDPSRASYSPPTPSINTASSYIPAAGINHAYLDLFKNYGNDLLWACFLVSTTIFLFYKMMNSNPSREYVPIERNNNLEANRLMQPPTEQPNYNNYHQYQANIAANQVVADQQMHSTKQVETQDIENVLNKSADTSNFHGAKNEEIELKISLAKQYIAAGDGQSAKDLLQSINIAKEKQYYDPVSILLKSVI